VDIVPVTEATTLSDRDPTTTARSKALRLVRHGRAPDVFAIYGVIFIRLDWLGLK
jgi:hypothetical protein